MFVVGEMQQRAEGECRKKDNSNAIGRCNGIESFEKKTRATQLDGVTV